MFCGLINSRRLSIRSHDGHLVEGPIEKLRAFLGRLRGRSPPPSVLEKEVDVRVADGPSIVREGQICKYVFWSPVWEVSIFPKFTTLTAQHDTDACAEMQGRAGRGVLFNTPRAAVLGQVPGCGRLYHLV